MTVFRKFEDSKNKDSILIIQQQIRNAKESGRITRILLHLQYHKQKIKKYIGKKVA